MGLSDNFYMALADNAGDEVSPFHVKYKVEKSDFTPEELKDVDNPGRFTMIPEMSGET